MERKTFLKKDEKTGFVNILVQIRFELYTVMLYFNKIIMLILNLVIQVNFNDKGETCNRSYNNTTA